MIEHYLHSITLKNDLLEKTITDHLNFLTETLDTRRTGTIGNKAAEEYIKSQYEKAGLQVELQRIPNLSWNVTFEQLSLGNSKLIGKANVFSPSCDITAPTVASCTLSELEKADMRSKICILYGDLSWDELVFIKKGYQPELDKKILNILQEKQPAGIITVCPFIGRTIRVIDNGIGIPSFTVPPETAVRLLDTLGERVHMQITATQKEDFSHNVIARKNNSSDKRVIFVAHYDTKIDTPGAFDNSSGTIVLLILASILSKLDLHCNLEFASVNAHEYIKEFHGSELHADEITRSTEKTLLVINVDGVGQKLGTNKICIGGHSQKSKQELEKIAVNYPGLIWVPLWYQSDHSSYLWKRLPVIAFDSNGLSSIHHHESDSKEWISALKVIEIINIIKDIVQVFHDKDPEFIIEEKS